MQLQNTFLKQKEKARLNTIHSVYHMVKFNNFSSYFGMIQIDYKNLNILLKILQNSPTNNYIHLVSNHQFAINSDQSEEYGRTRRDLVRAARGGDSPIKKSGILVGKF